MQSLMSGIWFALMRAERHRSLLVLLLSVMLLLPIGTQVENILATGQSDIVIAIYAPLDTTDLSKYLRDYSELTNNLQATVQQSPYIKIEAIVSALINDQQGTLLVRFSQGKSPELIAHGVMSLMDPVNLTNFVDYVYDQYPDPDTTIILAFEGHGGGYIPSITGIDQPDGTWPPENPDIPVSAVITHTTPISIGGNLLPHLPMGSPKLPGGLMSTYDLGQALHNAITAQDRPPLDVIFFNNCFMFAAELLNEIAPYAEYAVGYPNYNFFTAGGVYPSVIASMDPNAGNGDLAVRFATVNSALLNEDHPTVGSAIELARMETVAGAVDALAATLTDALETNRDVYQPLIASVLNDTHHYDSTECVEPDYYLDHEDSLIDVTSFAWVLGEQFAPAAAANSLGSGLSWAERIAYQPISQVSSTIYQAAQTVYQATTGVQVYGDSGIPWLNEAAYWDFSDQLSMSLFFPTPRNVAGSAYWDWRTSYYVQPSNTAEQIDFLVSTQWDEFVLAYHNGAVVDGLTVCMPTYAPVQPDELNP